jgi:hypothetical protein
MKLTVHEQHIWWMQQHARSYPRWKKFDGRFLFYIHPDSYMEEVYRNRAGSWTVGRKRDNTEKEFKDLQDAMNYGELLNNRREFAELKSRFNPAGLSSLVAFLSDAQKFHGTKKILVRNSWN